MISVNEDIFFSKYTKDDYDIKRMKEKEKLAYDFNFLNHDVDKNQKLNNSYQLFKDIKKFKKDPINSFNTILIFISLSLLLILVIISFIYSKFYKKNIVIGKYGYMFFAFILIFLLILYYIFSHIEKKFYISAK